MTDSPSSSPTSSPDLGLLLRRHRREAGLTQEELAEQAGISARAVSDIERGLRTTIYRDTAKRLADALKLAAAAAPGDVIVTTANDSGLKYLSTDLFPE